jgi:hypothetical protein
MFQKYHFFHNPKLQHHITRLVQPLHQIIYLLLYVDDTVIFAETAAELQSALNAMYLYCETCKLKVNTAKTNVVIFSKRTLKTTEG